MRGWLAPHGRGHLWALIVGAWVLSVGVFFLLQVMPPRWRRPMIMLFTFLGGCFYSVEFFLPPNNFLTSYKEGFGNAWVVMGSFAMPLGVLNLSLVHVKKIATRSGSWGGSIVYFTAMAAMVTFCFWQQYWPKSKAGGQGFELLFQYAYMPLGATMFSILAFYIVSAAYRAFRISTAEAGLMAAAAFVVMLGQVPLGMWLTHGIPVESRWAGLRVEQIAHWILAGINMAAVRGVLFGAAVGSLAMALRIWLSLERGAYFDQKV